MKLLNRLERKIGRYAVPNLMLYMIVLYVAGFLLDWLKPGFYENWLDLEIYYVLHGPESHLAQYRK